ncbi:MAG: c-type cytochrome biogenesis protein CcsB [Desulfobacterales bacterium]|nr:c-type cytochrome biogenesis protein CcsB [Desulfobacterales bacterium]MDJ0990629.1 c-type cytochrome biogenesis protein CcsB [Desulfobacterales bacterium]
MEIGILLTIVCYGASTAAYTVFLVRQRKFSYRTGVALLSAGFGIHLVLVLAGTLHSGHLPVNTLRDTLSFGAMCVAGVFLGFQYRYRLRVLGVFAAPLAAATMVVVALMPATSTPAQPILKSIWLVAHVTFIFMGEASLALACGLGILYLVQERAIKSRKPGFFFRRLPSLDLLDSAGQTCILAGFVLMTLGLATGLIYAKAIWGRFWSWDPKEVWSGITWLLYAVLIHERLALGWRGRRAAIMAIVGFATVLFTFLGVNLFMSGHHGAFTG